MNFLLSNIHVNGKALYTKSMELNGEYKKIPNFKFFIFFFLNLNLINLSSVQDACHMNFIIDLAHHGVSVAQW